MKVKLIRSVLIAGVHKDSGLSLDVDNDLARTLLGSGKAVIETEKPKAKPKAKPKVKTVVKDD
tara:strand:+ start:584 stop:772 length:189 start_codon:yes stop_codon:yes gene_type:complete